MTEKMTGAESRAAFEPFLRKHFTPEEIEAINARGAATFAASGHDQESIGKAWAGLVEEGQALMAAQDLTSARAKEFVRRWKALEDTFTLDDIQLHQKVGEVWRDALGDPAIGSRLPITAGLWSFVRRIAEGMRERGELPARATAIE